MKTLLMLCFSLLTACATITNHNYESQEITETEKKIIALDASTILTERYPPAKTTLNIQNNGQFSEFLINSLRQQGFAFGEQNAIPLQYTIDTLDNNIVLNLILPHWRGHALYIRQNDKISRKQLSQWIE